MRRNFKLHTSHVHVRYSTAEEADIAIAEAPDLLSRRFGRKIFARLSDEALLARYESVPLIREHCCDEDAPVVLSNFRKFATPEKEAKRAKVETSFEYEGEALFFHWVHARAFVQLRKRPLANM